MLLILPKLLKKGVKMKWKNRLTNYNFWISIVSAVLLILQNFDVHFDIANFNEIVTGVLGLLVVIGIINDPTKSSTTTGESLNKNKGDTVEELQEVISNQAETENATVIDVNTNGNGSIDKIEIENLNSATEEIAQESQPEELNETHLVNAEQVFKTPISLADENDICPTKTTDEIFINPQDEPSTPASNLITECLEIGENQSVTKETEIQQTIETSLNPIIEENKQDENSLASNSTELKTGVEESSKTAEEDGVDSVTSFSIVR